LDLGPRKVIGLCCQASVHFVGQCGGLAQLGEHLPYKQRVGGSIPSASTITIRMIIVAGWSSPVARRAHNPKVAGSNPAPATKYGAVVKLEFTPVCHTGGRGFESRQLRHFIASDQNGAPRTGYGSVAQSVEQRTENPRVGGSIPSRTTISFHRILPV
jgi:hypothetical protein